MYVGWIEKWGKGWSWMGFFGNMKADYYPT